MTHCPLCRKRVLEDRAPAAPGAGTPNGAPNGTAAAQPAIAAAPAAQALVANGTSHDAAPVAAPQAAEVASPAAPVRRSMSSSSATDLTRGWAVSVELVLAWEQGVATAHAAAAGDGQIRERALVLLCTGAMHLQPQGMVAAEGQAEAAAGGGHGGVPAAGQRRRAGRLGAGVQSASCLPCLNSWAAHSLHPSVRITYNGAHSHGGVQHGGQR